MPIDTTLHRTNAGRHEYRQVHAAPESHPRGPQGLSGDTRRFAAELSHISQAPQDFTRLSAALSDARPSAITTFTREQKALLERVSSPIEIDGSLVPVTVSTTPGHDLHHEVVDPWQTGDVGLPIAFDGARWRFEADSAPQVSKEVKHPVTSAMFVSDTPSARPSAPDPRGLNRDMQINERLQHLRTVGVHGHRRMTPRALLQDGCMTPQGARALLAQYAFPGRQGADGKQSLYCEYDFARYVHEHESTPAWAERYKRPRLAPRPEPENGIVTVKDPNSPDDTPALRLGAQLGEGNWGDVYVDADHPDYVIKRFKKIGNFDNASESDINENTAPFEAEAFRRYYGEDSATVYVDVDDVNYLRMLRVPGQTINDLPVNSLPSDAIERYVDMLGRLQACGILHNDLHGDNVLWDGERFNPIDMQNVRESYFAATAEDKNLYNSMGTEVWEDLTAQISRKMRDAPSPAKPALGAVSQRLDAKVAAPGALGHSLFERQKPVRRRELRCREASF